MVVLSFKKICIESRNNVDYHFHKLIWPMFFINKTTAKTWAYKPSLAIERANIVKKIMSRCIYHKLNISS